MHASDISGGAGKGPHFPYMRITGAGLMLGRGVLLAKMDEEGLCIDEDSILILLAIAQRRELSQTVIPAIGRAAKHWRSGDKALAAIHLAQIGLRKIDEEDAESLRLAAGLLDAGMSPRELARELGLNIQFRARKYEDSQPRVPAGNGRASGQWTSGGAAGSAAAAPMVEGRSGSISDAMTVVEGAPKCRKKILSRKIMISRRTQSPSRGQMELL